MHCIPPLGNNKDIYKTAHCMVTPNILWILLFAWSFFMLTQVKNVYQVEGLQEFVVLKVAKT